MDLKEKKGHVGVSVIPVRSSVKGHVVLTLNVLKNMCVAV